MDNGGTVVVDPVAANNWQDPQNRCRRLADRHGYRAGRHDGGPYRHLWCLHLEWDAVAAAGDVNEHARWNRDAGIAEGVYEIQIAPSNTNILYMEYLGDVYRSSDKGTTWTTNGVRSGY